MAPIQVDFTNVDPVSEPGSGPLPDGEYLVMVDEAKERTSQKGTPGIALTLKVIGGEYEGRPLFDDLWITPAAMGYVLHRLQCLGVQVPAGSFGLDARGLVSRRARVIVRQEEGQDGKVRARVKGWEPAQQAAQDDPLAQAHTQAGPPPHTDDDIPF